MTQDIVGPIDCVLLAFDEHQPLDEVSDALHRLVETDTIRIYDIVLVRKHDDGSVDGLAVSDLGDEVGLAAFAGARSGMIDHGDVADAGAMMAVGTTALLLLYENAWAVPMVGATRRAGGDVVALAHLTGDQVNDALDALEKES